MQFTLKEIRDITSDIIDKSFTLLRGKKIFVFTGPLRFYAFSVWIPPFFRVIVLSNKTTGFNEKVLTGLIVHELCHQERYIEMGLIKYLVFAVKFLLLKRIRSAEEKSTDRLTIEKGYGRELYELSTITHKDRKHKKINDLYLSLEEIRAYSESLGKWGE
ncbi:MAG: hypothetical protein GX431_14700 [Bacteroidales bacterium]|jgi:hypothetical protein|nr:hypothetical protein [Bacteroidales bacterium]